MDDATTRQLSWTEKQEISDLLAREGKIAAIKYLRNRFDIRLLAAKRLLDEWDRPGSLDRYLLPQPVDHTLELPRDSRSGKGNWWGLVVASVFLMVGAGFLAGSYLVWSSQQELVRHGAKVDGSVVGLYSNGSGMAPVFEYEWDGEILRSRSQISSRPASYQIGESVEIFVNPTNPEQALVNDFLHRWLLVMIFALLGGGLSLAALVGGLVARA